MPRDYKRKTNRQSWSADCMTKALQEVLEGRMGYKKAAQTFSIPQSTLEDKVKRSRKTPIARAETFHRTAVSKFYDLLNSIYEKRNLSPNDIYNVDETGFLKVPNTQSKVLAFRGKKQVGCLSSAERRVLVTAEVCMNAARNFMRPMFVFPCKRENPLLMHDAPPGSFAYYHESGWINTESFHGHRSPSKSMALIDGARENVTLLCFPPRTTHRLQPLDVSFMAPFSAYYEQEVRKWLVPHPGRAVAIYQIGKLFTATFTRAVIMQTAIAGFTKTGICQFNRDVFPEHLQPQPSTSSCSSSFSTCPRMLMPPPQEEQKVRTKHNRRKGKTAILASSPYKLELEKE
ncbi:hypothetical protein ILUMI_20064 [Ignelater luminosus]|uniref:HTH psq-type domain-containing protein n=1 Tax=Ignelater luminosus TaxID=2038154 RepID=A0A8K0FZA1_IGNLU|nr:hypothetical protein ILUMI_20064 [Ignelater luminosus]